MNERIKELAGQARKYARDYVAECRHYGHYMEHNEYELRFAEKFAELIIRECVRYFNEDYQRDFDTLWREDLTKGIKEHFGVKA